MHFLLVFQLFCVCTCVSLSFNLILWCVYISVPTPSVTVTVLNTRIVGQSLTLKCRVTTVRGINSRVDIIWRRNGTEVMRSNNILSTMMDSSLIYTDTYNISRLSTDDENREYACEIVVSDSVTLNVIGKELCIWYQSNMSVNLFILFLIAHIWVRSVKHFCSLWPCSLIL